MALDSLRHEAAEVEVAIIGYGPVGATLANLLGQCGIRTLVIEREAAAYHLPRAVHFDDEVMRVFQSIGLAEAIERKTHVSPGMRFLDAEGRLLLDWSRPMGRGPQQWHASYRFHQPELEDTLRAGLARHESVEVLARTEVFALDEDEDGVTIRAERLAGGELIRRRARYVVGCDGARSTVRRFIGAGMEDLGFHEPWLVVDALLNGEKPELGDFSLQHCNPARPATYVRGTGRRRRWEIALLEGEDPAAMCRPEMVWSLLSPWLAPQEAELERAAAYVFHSAIATRWRRGRLLLAGDAAHLTPPFLGQGMCAGIRDVANLAWKLEAVLRGRAGDALLDTYESERSPHVRAYIELAIRLGGLINTRAMDKALPAETLARGVAARMSSIHPVLGPGLGDGWPAPRGTVAPQPMLAHGVRLDDALGPAFALLATEEAAEALPPAARALMQRLGIRLVTEPAVLPWLADLGAQAVLLRPDRYVFAAARQTRDLAALFDTLAGAFGAAHEFLGDAA